MLLTAQLSLSRLEPRAAFADAEPSSRPKHGVYTSLGSVKSTQDKARKAAFGPCYTPGVTELQALLGVASRDPFLFYTLTAALFLAAVSLGTGWLRQDFVAILRPHGLLAVVLAVLAGFSLLWLPRELGLALPAWLSEGASRFPLYLVALAYGPSAGLLAALLFAAFATSSSLPGLPEAVLALELTVLGWFAVAPSPRRYRWAGPLGVLLAYLLTWATGGSAMLQYLTGNGAAWATQWSYQQPLLGGVLFACLLLLLVGPEAYRRLFPGSRILPSAQGDAPLASQTGQRAAEALEPTPHTLQLPLFADDHPGPGSKPKV